jgi:hypothetical protein
MHSDDGRLARASRLLRQRQQLRQPDLVIPGRSRHFTRRLEAGLAGELRLGDLREHFAVMGARLRVSVWWNGALLDRLLDEEHAGIVETAVGEVRRYSWFVDTEVTFSEFGERGSIDLFGRQEVKRAVLVGEVKSAWGSMEETLRSLDVKERLAPKICFQRWGWRPISVGKVLILPEERTARRVAQRHARTLGAALPARNRQVRAWLRRPDGPLRGLWFLTDVHADERRRR